MVWPTLYVDWESDDIGHGIFTDTELNAGDVIDEYLGERIDGKARLRRRPNRYTIVLEDGSCIDASNQGSLARFVNHHCTRYNA